MSHVEVRLIGELRCTLLCDQVSESAAALTKQVFDLSEGGPTALGPAVVVATALAASVSGSKVWLFPIPLVELSCAAAALAVSEARTCPSTHIQNHDHNHIAQRCHGCAFSVSRQREVACLTHVSVCCLCQPVGTAADRGVH